MTPRDGFPDASRLGFSARSAWRGDAGRRPKAPVHKTWGSRHSDRAGEPAVGCIRGRREALPMSRIARAISRGRYQRSLV